MEIVQALDLAVTGFEFQLLLCNYLTSGTLFNLSSCSEVPAGTLRRCGHERGDPYRLFKAFGLSGVALKAPLASTAPQPGHAHLPAILERVSNQ